MIKPCEAHDESPFWPWDGPFYFDMSTMWDLYKTHLPLMLSLYPDFGSDFVNSLLNIVEIEVTSRLVTAWLRLRPFCSPGQALSHVTIADALTRGLKGIDWERVATMITRDLKRGGVGEAFLQQGVVHPITHTLDMAYGCYCTHAWRSILVMTGCARR